MVSSLFCVFFNNMTVDDSSAKQDDMDSPWKADAVTGEQLPRGYYLVFTDRPCKELHEKGMMFSIHTSFFCVDPYKTCRRDVLVDGGFQLQKSCASCCKLQGHILESLSEIGFSDVKLVHWGPHLQQHACIVGPMGDDTLYTVHKLIFKKLPWIDPFMHLHVTGGPMKATAEGNTRITMIRK